MKFQAAATPIICTPSTEQRYMPEPKESAAVVSRLAIDLLVVDLGKKDVREVSGDIV